MRLSIRQIFFNLKLSLFILGMGITFLTIILLTISQYSQHLDALKNQHALIKKITATNLHDSDMASITINGDISGLALFAKLTIKETLLDSILSSDEEQKSLSRTLMSTSTAFQESALFWLESMPVSRDAMYERMISARNLYLINIDNMIDYQIHLINESVGVAKITVLIITLLGLITFFFYQWRLNQIYRDIKKASSVDTDGTIHEVVTEEIDFIIKRLARKIPMVNTNPTLLNPQSGLNNQKGMLSVYTIKRNNKMAGSLFVVLFEIDQYKELEATLSKEDMGAIYKKLADILSMYEQPLDILAHLDDNRFAFIMARNSKDLALSEAEKIVESVKDSIFTTQQGVQKITLSGAIILKVPSKTLEESLPDVAKLIEKAKESGGNRIAQLRDKADMFR
ncbi:MAG: diguanylate cyclase [Sulfuricurvum sp.]|nr:diguanylate cyclase [Sulfuricurvum sp.]